jgi:hypothetical protein
MYEPTYRRLNDGTRYWGMTWRGWACASVGGGLLYAAARLSPLHDVRLTLMFLLWLSGAAIVVQIAVTGKALSPGQYILAYMRWRFGSRAWTTPGSEQAISGGRRVDAIPLGLDATTDTAPAWLDDIEEDDHEHIA